MTTRQPIMKGNSYSANFLKQKLAMGAPAPAPAVEATLPATNANANTVEQAQEAPDFVAQPTEPRRRRVLDAGEEAHLDKRRRKRRIPGLIRGGKNSPEWGVNDTWSGGMMPAAYVQLLKELALGHRLHEWQIRVEAMDLFVKKHGMKTGTKSST